MSEFKFEFDPHIETAWTIPSRLYTDPAFLELEKKMIFHRTWQLAGLASAAAAPGSYFTTEIAGEPVLVCRDEKNDLHAFFNVCRHRAGAVAEGAGCRKTFQCGYHGWTYTLDGRLIGTPDVDGVEFFDRSTMGLVPVRAEVWEQFVFINLSPSAPPLEAFLEDIPTQVRAMRLPALGRVERREYIIACTWKVYVDNYLEGYHIPIAHPGLMKEIDYANYRVETHRYYSRQFAPVRGAAAGAADRVYAAAGGTEALFLWVFPNLMLNVYPNNIEKVLSEHPAVMEVGVAAIPHPDADKSGQEALKAWVVLRPDQTATEKELIDHCMKRLARYEVPTRISFIKELPKTTVGKTLRRELVQMEMADREKALQ